MSSQRSNGALYYKVKWNNSKSDWYFPCKIPNNLIREYHVHRTMSGKRRKKPLQKGHKFFADHTVNVVENPTNVEQDRTNKIEVPNETKLVGVKLINGRSYYLMQKGNSAPKCQPTTIAHWHARQFILYLIQYFKKDLQECKINAIRNRHNPVQNPPDGLKNVLCDSVHEIFIQEDGTVEFLVSYRSPHLPPDWVRLEELATGSLNILIDSLKKDYYAAIGKRV